MRSCVPSISPGAKGCQRTGSLDAPGEVGQGQGGMPVPVLGSGAGGCKQDNGNPVRVLHLIWYMAVGWCLTFSGLQFPHLQNEDVCVSGWSRRAWVMVQAMVKALGFGIGHPSSKDLPVTGAVASRTLCPLWPLFARPISGIHAAPLDVAKAVEGVRGQWVETHLQKTSRKAQGYLSHPPGRWMTLLTATKGNAALCHQSSFCCLLWSLRQS